MDFLNVRVKNNSSLSLSYLVALTVKNSMKMTFLTIKIYFISFLRIS